MKQQQYPLRISFHKNLVFNRLDKSQKTSIQSNPLNPPKVVCLANRKGLSILFVNCYSTHLSMFALYLLPNSIQGFYNCV